MKSTRRQFVRCSGASLLAMPFISTAQKGDGGEVVVGDGAHRYAVDHDWAKLPDEFKWQTTHNVAVDRAQNLYVIHEGVKGVDHPAIFVFDVEGKFVRSFGEQFQGGGHGLEVRDENGTEFLYVTGYQHLKNFAKLTLTGEQVWEKRAPMESGIYKKGEDTNPGKVWGRDRFMPTNFAFHPTDGGYYLADGYGGHCVHRYDKENRWVSTFGKPGKGDGEFNLPHGLWIDDRGDAPSVVVADRANARLQWFDLDGKHLRTQGDFILPANVDVHGDLMLVPDLSARVTLLGKDNQVVAQLGENAAWREEVLKDNKKMRTQPTRWEAGRFVHPHDACFDAAGNIFVAEWVATGRVTRLRKLA